MRVVILAGGKGTRISEESKLIPKPMIEIGNIPILERVMSIYEHQGFNDFILLTGYKSNHIVSHFMSNMDYDKTRDGIVLRDSKRTITIIYTGLDTLTGGRLGYLKGAVCEPFLMTYGDGVGNIKIQDVIDVFDVENSLVTVTAVHPAGRFGSVILEGNKVIYFGEKTDNSNQWINGGFMVIHPKTLEYIDGQDTNFEKDVLPVISEMGKLSAYRHTGFWMCMDTLRDKENLEDVLNTKGEIWLNM